MNSLSDSKYPSQVLHWCMSLTRRPDRRFVIERSFPSHISQQLRFFPAVDARRIPEKQPKAGKVQQMDRRAYAVRVSKMLLLREFLATGGDHLCFYEDDVCLMEEFEESLQLAVQHTAAWDCFFLGGTHQEAPVGEGVILRCVDTFDNHCVLFNRSGAKKVLSLLIHMPSGCAWSDREIASAIKQGSLLASCLPNFVAAQRVNLSDNTADRYRGPKLYDPALAPRLGPEDAHVLHYAVEKGHRVLQFGQGPSSALLERRCAKYRCIEAVNQKESRLRQIQDERWDIVHLTNLPCEEELQTAVKQHLPGGLLIATHAVAVELDKGVASMDAYRPLFKTPHREDSREPQGISIYLRL